MKSIFLVEDHDLVREGIKLLLQGEPGITIIGEARNGAEAIQKIDTSKPDIILMDINMPVMNGLDCTRKIKQEFPHIKIIVLSMHDHEEYLIDMLNAGANGYILKSAAKDELLFAINKIANNGVYVATEFIFTMLSKYKTSLAYTPICPDINITDCEKDVLNLIAKGRTNNEIAKELFTSVRTIETRRKSLLDKTKATNTATLIRFAVLNRLIN